MACSSPAICPVRRLGTLTSSLSAQTFVRDRPALHPYRSSLVRLLERENGTERSRLSIRIAEEMPAQALLALGWPDDQPASAGPLLFPFRIVHFTYFRLRAVIEIRNE